VGGDLLDVDPEKARLLEALLDPPVSIGA